MCGIAGMIDLAERRPLPLGVLEKMAQGMVHRGPDEDGFFEDPGLGFANRRLSIVGLFDGRQPITNEDGSVTCVFNGEFFDFREKRAELEKRGHHFRTHADTELIPHLWEEYGEGMFEHLKGQFSFALFDKKKQQIIIARDRIGIIPLFWTQKPDGWLLFASEIKVLLRSGLVKAEPEPRGINQIFTFFAVPGTPTCFKGIQLLTPGHYLSIKLNPGHGVARVDDREYWYIDYPDRGQEDPGTDPGTVDDFERIVYNAIEKRLRADVPVVSYLSGGLDSSLVVAMATKILGRPIPTFTVRVKEPEYDEWQYANTVNKHVGSSSVVVTYGATEMLDHYPRLVYAAESPVIDTSCAAVMLLAEQVHSHGFKVVLTGEGADEWMAGYPWFRYCKAFGMADAIPGIKLSEAIRRIYLYLMRAPKGTWDIAKAGEKTLGGYNAWIDVYTLMMMGQLRFYTEQMRESLRDHEPFADLKLDRNRTQRWHPLNQSLAVGVRTMLPGMLLAAKGDRVAMHSSVEGRYPFLDEDVAAFIAKIHPRWKLRGFCEKYLLRRVAERWLPKSIAWRRKYMFRAPMDTFHKAQAHLMDQLLSEDSLKRTGYFDVKQVHYWRNKYQKMMKGHHRTSVEMGLVGVVATQLWHHIYVDANLADLPGWQSVSRNGVSKIAMKPTLLKVG